MRVSSLLRHIESLWRNRSGNVAVIFGLSLLPLIGLSAMAVDYSRASVMQARAQAALDAAVLGGAAQPASSRVQVATNSFSGNFSPFTGITAPTPTFTTNADGSFSGSATFTVPTTLGATIGIPSVTVAVSATAIAKTTSSTTNNVCILVLDPSSAQTLLVNSGVNLNAPKCEIDVASTNTTAAMINSSLPNVGSVCIAGGYTLNGGSTVNNISKNCKTATDTIAGTIPSPTVGACTISNQNYSGTVNLSPGTYCGNFNFNGSGTLSLASGVYIFSGTHWNLNSGWSITGSGVTFYFADSSSYIQFNSNVSVNLSAPTSGTYSNVLMFEPSGLSKSSFAVDGTSTGHALQGLIYLPSRNITFNSSANVTSDALTLVVNQIIFDTVTWSMSPSANALASKNGPTSTMVVLEK
jgi:Flp pilus assembly protein TadG